MDAPPTKPAAPVPAKVVTPPPTKTHAVRQPKPVGWFSFAQKGMRASVLKAVNESADLTEGWKRAIASDIQALDASLNFVAVDCHRHQQDGKAVVHFTLDAKTVLAG